MFSSLPIDRKRGIAAAAYLTASALLVLCVAWGTVAVATRAVSMIDDAIIDGSGRLAAGAIEPQTTNNLQAASAQVEIKPAAPSAERASPQLTAAPRISTDKPDQDPAWSFHSGSSDTYRTYCVRLCDGFFWPVSFSTTGDRFEQDQATCASACGSPARLFVHKMPGGGPGTMVSLDGLPYAALKSAFLFRTKYVEACRCQPQPWEQQAADRHKLYAASAAARKGDHTATATVAILKARVEAHSRQAAAELEVANVAATRELTQLARKAGGDAPPRIATRKQQKPAANPRLADADREDGMFMGLGAYPGTDSRSGKAGYRPVTGPGRNWREKAFADH